VQCDAIGDQRLGVPWILQQLPADLHHDGASLRPRGYG
jgi:hypothetical protein